MNDQPEEGDQATRGIIEALNEAQDVHVTDGSRQ